MTAGFDCDDSGDRPGDEDMMQQQTEEPDWYRYSLNVPMACLGRLGIPAARCEEMCWSGD